MDKDNFSGFGLVLSGFGLVLHQVLLGLVSQDLDAYTI